MQLNLKLARILPALIVVLAACQPGAHATLDGRATLDGQSDHSGIVVTLAGPSSAVTETAADGSFRFSNLAEGSYVVVAAASGTREGALTTGANTSQGRFPDLLFHPVGGLSGRVTRGGAAAGNQGILVLAQASSGLATTDDSGSFLLADLAPGSYDLNAFTSGFLPGTARSLSVTRGVTTTAPTLDLQAAPEGQAAVGDLRGQARLTGVDDASGITVSLAGTSLFTVTAADGSFVLPEPPQGIYGLSFDSGLFHETAPSVLAVPGASGFYLDGTLYPLGASTLVAPRGRRLQSGAISGLRRSPNGDQLLFLITNPPPPGVTAPTYTLMTVPASGGAPVIIAQRAANNWSFSPDGARVLYATGPDDNFAYSLFTAPVGGGASQLLASGIQPYFQYSPDGGHVFVNATYSGGDLTVIPAGGGTPLKLASQVEPYSTRSSPSGDEVLIMANCVPQGSGNPPCDLLLAPTSGATPFTISSGVTWFVASDGIERAAYYANGKFYVVDLSSKASTLLYSGSLATFGRFSADGSHLLFLQTPDQNTSTGDLESYSFESGTTTLLASGVTSDVAHLSPGGALVYLQGYQDTALRVVPIDGGTTTTLAMNGPPGVGFHFSGTGNQVAMLSDLDPATDTVTLSVGPSEGGPLRVVAVSVLQRSVTFSSDGGQLAYLADDGHLGESGWVEVTATGGSGKTRLAGGGGSIVGFSPSGADLVYGSAERSPTSWAVPTAGGAAHALLDQTTTALFATDELVAGVRAGAPAPFSFQNGLYLLSAH